MSTTPLKKVPTEVAPLDGAPDNAARDAAAPKPAAEAKPADAKEAKPEAAAKPKEAKPAPVVEAKPKEAKPVAVVEAKPKEAKPVAVVEAKPKEAKPVKVVDATPKEAKPAAVVEAKPKAVKSVTDAKPKQDTRPLSPDAQPTAPAASPVAQHVHDATLAVRSLRRARARRLGLRVAFGVGLPTLLASIYFFLLASSQYESVSLFMVQSAEGRGGLSIESLIGAVPGVSAARDTLAVRDFITSREMLAVLARDVKLPEHYENPTNDWWARLDNRASSENVYEYYREVVQVDHDSNSGVLTLRVRAFSPQFAKRVSEVVLSESEKMVNELSERARLDQTKVARAEVEKQEARLTKARQAIVALQRDHAEFSPEMTASEAFSLRGSLKGELAKARAELMEARAFMQPGAPRVVAAEERVRSLSAQVSEESQRLVNPKGDSGLGNRMADFEAAMVEKEFAQSAYQAALASLELARNEAARQHRYLATISKPSLPDEETHPKRVRGVVTVVLLSAMLLGMLMLLVEAIRDHARI